MLGKHRTMSAEADAQRNNLIAQALGITVAEASSLLTSETTLLGVDEDEVGDETYANYADEERELFLGRSLHDAVRRCALDEVLTCLQACASAAARQALVSEVDALGATPLWHACAAPPRIEIVTALLDAQADVHHCAPTGDLALHAASRDHCLEVIQLLIDRRADVNATGHVAYTPLKVAISGPIYPARSSPERHVEAVKMLVEARADVNAGGGARDSISLISSTSLASDSSPGASHEALLAADSDLPLDPPLCIAARCGRLAVVKLLLSAQADLSFRDHLGRSALDQAQGRDHAAVASLLRQANRKGAA